MEVSLTSELEANVDVSTSDEEAKELISVLGKIEDRTLEAMEEDSTNDIDSVTVADEAIDDENTMLEETANEVLSTTTVDDCTEVSMLELDIKVDDGKTVSLWEIDTREVWLAMLGATEDDSKTDEMRLVDETRDRDSTVEETIDEMLDITIVEDSSVCEDAKVEDESTIVELARELDTKELSSVDDARLSALETKVDEINADV